jgi:hypothetical protein
LDVAADVFLRRAQTQVRVVAARWWIHGALAVVVVTASILRLGGITRVGIRFDDEGAYVGDARLWYRCALVLTDRQSLGAGMRGDKAALKRRMDDLGVDFGARYAKPSQGYTFLGAAAMFVVGDRPAALLVLNAVSGVLAVILTYAIGSTLFGRRPGLCAAAFLAVSPYHLVYCRSALTEATAGLFVLLGLWIWIIGVKRRWSPRWSYGLSGIALGYAATCHYRCLYVPGVLILADIMMSQWRGTDGKRPAGRLSAAAVRWSWLAAGVALPAILFELLFRTARGAAWLSDSYLPVGTYFAAGTKWASKILVSGAADVTGGPLSPVLNAQAYFGYFVHWHGVAAALLTLVGLLVTVRKSGLGRIPALLALVTLTLVMIQPYSVARAMSTAIPALCLCAAVGAFWITDLGRLRHRWKAAVVSALVLLFVASALTRSRALYARHSSIANACAFVAARGPATVAIPLDTYHRSKYWLYLEGTDVNVVNGMFHNLGSPEAVIARLRSDGVRWIIMDPQRWHYRDTRPGSKNLVFRWWEAMDDYLSREAALAAEFPHIVDACWEFLAEGPGLAHLDEMIRRRAGRLGIYDLTACDSVARR